MKSLDFGWVSGATEEKFIFSGQWVHTFSLKHFNDFLEISYFPKILNSNLFGQQFGNYQIYFLEIIL